MRRALIALLVLTGVASAEDEDPKAAIATRGIVLKAGKRHLVVIVPAETKQAGDDPSSKLHRATLYFGDTKTLFKLQPGSWKIESATSEHIELSDPRAIISSKLARKDDTFTLQCADYNDSRESRRTITLTAADAKTVSLAGKAALKLLAMPYRAYLLLRVPHTTQYVYVDRNIEPDSQDFRLFAGKRGAMKRIPVKEVANDSTSLTLVTAKGTLTSKSSTQKDALPTVTFGPAKKPQTLDVVPTWPNRQLIYTELGVYTRDRTGYPCDEL